MDIKKKKNLMMKCDWKLAITTIIASPILGIFSPIENKNRTLDSNEKRRYKKITIALVIAFLLLEIFLFFLGLYIYTINVAIGIQLVAGLQVFSIVRKYRFSKKGL